MSEASTIETPVERGTRAVPSVGALPADRSVLRWRAQFRDPALEEMFRRHSLPWDRMLTQISIGTMAFAAASFVIVDFRFHLGTRLFAPLVVARVMYLLVAAAAATIVRSRKSSIRKADAAAFIWAAVATNGFILAISFVRPPHFTQHAATCATAVVAYFIVARMPFTLQFVASIVLMVGEGAVLAVHSSDGLMALGAGVLVLLFFVTSAISSWLLHRWQREQFVALHVESKLRGDLEEAMASVKTLESMLPICASCKKIRDEGGVWHPVEVYVRDRTGTRFSHGLCPECVETLYGQAP